MVRVLAVADETVSTMRARAVGLDVDLVVAAGDLPWDYLVTLVSLVGVPAVFVPGNHEPAMSADAAPRGMVSADEQVLDVGGLRVVGLGGCVRYNDGDHQYTQQQYEVRARRLLDRTTSPIDVLVTHAPPLGLGDGSDPSHVGIAALHEVIEVLRPTWHLHGHIHPHGMLKPDRHVGRTTVRNVIPWDVLDIEAA